MTQPIDTTAWHPLHDFSFCPRCGSKSFLVHDAKAKRCRACGFVLYQNAAAAVAAVVFDAKGRLLAVRRRFEPAKDTLDLPGGFVDPGEDAETAVVREVWEETGCRATVEAYLFSVPNEYLFSDHIVHTTDLFFRLRLEEGSEPVAHDDASETLWLGPAEIDPAQFGLASIRRAVARLFSK